MQLQGNHGSRSTMFGARAATGMVGPGSLAFRGIHRFERRNRCLMRLYMFEHCSLCFRARMIAALASVIRKK
jgi:hypothetical protein